MKMDIANIRRLLCLCQIYLVCFIWSSHFQFAADCHFYISGSTVYQHEQRNFYFSGLFYGGLGTYGKYCYSRDTQFLLLNL